MSVFWSQWLALTDPAIKYPDIDLYYESSDLVWQTPDWFHPVALSQAPEQFSYWLDVLPYDQYKDEDLYMVIPQLGLITPIIDIPEWSGDEALMTQWQNININKYLNNGVIEYVKSVDPGYYGKRIDFGHSNFFANGAGDFKTIFANLMWLDAGDQVWYYQRNDGGTYDLYKYDITSSYPTDPSDVSALERDGTWADALVFGCYHGLDGRWMVEASYIGTPKWDSAGKQTYELLWSRIKYRIDTAVDTIQHMWINNRKVAIIKITNWIKGIETEVTTEYDRQLLSYIKQELFSIYPQ